MFLTMRKVCFLIKLICFIKLIDFGVVHHVSDSGIVLVNEIAKLIDKPGLHNAQEAR